MIFFEPKYIMKALTYHACSSHSRISRKEPLSKSCVHFFTSHFYTTLRVEGVNAVSSWTSKKGIDIFSKSIIFLPINQTLHWSLCAIMNPGTIQKVVDVSEESSVSVRIFFFFYLFSRNFYFTLNFHINNYF